MNRNRNTPPNDGSQALDPTRRDALASLGALALVAASISTAGAASSALTGKIAEYRRLTNLATDADERTSLVRKAFDEHARKNARYVPYAGGKAQLRVESIYGAPSNAIQIAAREDIAKLLRSRTDTDTRTALAGIERILEAEERDVEAYRQAMKQLSDEADTFGLASAEAEEDALSDSALAAYEEVLSYRPRCLEEVWEYIAFLREEGVISTASIPAQRHIDMIFGSLTATDTRRAA